MSTEKTIVGQISNDTLAFTAGDDIRLDLSLVEADCLGTAAHVTMLAKIPNPIVSQAECDSVIQGLVEILQRARKGTFKIRPADQDVHLAIERQLTRSLGDVGKRIHTGRSRNDQVAVALRIYAKQQLQAIQKELAGTSEALLKLAKRHRHVPMVGRTHMQPAMPSSVGLWAAAHAESLLDDAILLEGAYTYNDVCPLGAAAGYGVPLPLDRQLTSDLLGFSRPHGNTIYAVDARGKCEGVLLSSCAQIMMSLSRLAQDMMLYTMPEFGYFTIPSEYATGSSIMPQKRNPDVFELIRARSHVVLGYGQTVQSIMMGLPSGYNRDAQETKAPFMDGLRVTRECLSMTQSVMSRLEVHAERLEAGFNGGVFATDAALKMVADGTPFRDAYQHVKAHLDALENEDPGEAIRAKTHLGTTGGIDFDRYRKRVQSIRSTARRQTRHFERHASSLLGVNWSDLVSSP